MRPGLMDDYKMTATEAAMVQTAQDRDDAIRRLNHLERALDGAYKNATRELGKLREALYEELVTEPALVATRDARWIQGVIGHGLEVTVDIKATGVKVTVL